VVTGGFGVTLDDAIDAWVAAGSTNVAAFSPSSRKRVES